MSSSVVAFPAVLDDSENNPGEYTVTFPDVPGAISQGDGIAEALLNGADALGLILYDEEILPNPSVLAEVEKENPGTVVSYITVDLKTIASRNMDKDTSQQKRIAELSKQGRIRVLDSNEKFEAWLNEDEDEKVYRVLENDEVVGVFKKEEYAEDFVEYQKTISDTEFLVEEIPLADWLSQSTKF